MKRENIFGFGKKSLCCSLQKRKQTIFFFADTRKASLRVKWEGVFERYFLGGYLRWAFEAAGILGVGKCRRCGPIGHCGTEVSRAAGRKLWGTRPLKPRVGRLVSY